MTRPPRVAAAQLSHETNRFSVVATDLAAFQAAGLVYGSNAVTSARGTNSAFGGFATGAARHGFALCPILSVWATPSGVVTSDAIMLLCRELLGGITNLLATGPLDGVLLALHGAMVTEIDDDGDGYVLQCVRETVGPDVPIVATLDLHANISHRMVDAADVLIGYDTYPHVDMAQRADEACDVLARLVSEGIAPAAVLVKPPMLPTSQRMTTDRDPMRTLIAMAQAAELDPRVLNVTVAGGFPPADVPEAGLSVLVTTTGDPSLASAVAEEIAAEAWSRRAEFLGGVTSRDAVLRVLADLPRAPTSPACPLVLVDIGDNPWTGSPGDSVEIVRILLEAAVPDAAVAVVVDPAAVRLARETNVGGSLVVELGGKTDDLHGKPLTVAAEVRLLSDGRYRNAGPMMAGVPVDLGPTAVLRCRRANAEGAVGATVDVVVTSRAETPIDLNVFRTNGIEPTMLKVIGLKGKGHFRAAFEPIASQVILFEGPGISGADLGRLPLRRVRRPIWPLDGV